MSIEMGMVWLWNCILQRRHCVVQSMFETFIRAALDDNGCPFGSPFNFTDPFSNSIRQLSSNSSTLHRSIVDRHATRAHSIPDCAATKLPNIGVEVPIWQ